MKKLLVLLAVVAALTMAVTVMASGVVFGTFSAYDNDPPTGGGGVLFNDGTIKGSLLAVYPEYIIHYTGISWEPTEDEDIITVCSTYVVLWGTDPGLPLTCENGTGVAVDFIDGGVIGPGGQWIDVRFH